MKYVSLLPAEVYTYFNIFIFFKEVANLLEWLIGSIFDSSGVML